MRRLHKLLMGAGVVALGVWTVGALVAAAAPQSRGALVFGDPPAKRPPASGPREAFEWRRLAWKDENGRYSNAQYQQALEQRRANADYWSQSAQDASMVPWVFRGPGNIGGRSRSILINPSNASNMIAGSVGGGIWRTTNGGTTWTRAGDWLASLAIGSLAATPGDWNTQYAGTGEGFFNGDAIGGNGILKSKDGGQTWSKIPGTESLDNVCRIAVSPSNANIVLASSRYGGIWRSTNAGTSWTKVYDAQGSYQVAFDQTNGNKAVAHIINYDTNWYHAALYSTNGGITWTMATGLGKQYNFESRIELAYAPSNTTIVYASCAASGGKVWKSTNSGQSYTLATTTGSSGANWYACPIWVSPTNPDHLVVGGTHVYRSTNGGVTLSQISNGYIMTANAHPDIHFFASEPGFNGTTNRRLWVATDGGIYLSTDYTAATTGGATWQNKDQGYNTVQYYGAAGHGPSDRITGGTQDNGTHTVTGASTSATLTFGGDGGFSAIDPTDNNYIYGEYVYLTIHRSTNGGASANYIYSGISDAYNTANFIAPFILDPNNANTMFGGGSRLWRSTNVKAGVPTWTAIKASIGDYISAIAVRPGNSNEIWVGYNGGTVAKTINGGSTWTTIAGLPARYVTRIAFDSLNPSTVYVANGGFSPDNLRRSTNGGASWTDVTGSGTTGLPDAPIRGFVVHPQNSQRLYAGTEVGLFTSADGGNTWSTNDFGPANVSVDEVNFMSNSTKLLVATHGRGLWTANLPNPAGKVSGTVNLGDWGATRNGLQVNFEFTAPGSGTVLASKLVTLNGSGSYSFDPDLAAGTYDVYVKSSHWLRRKLSATLLSSSTTVNATLPFNGDCDGDNAVTVFDYGQLSSAFDSLPGNGNWDPNADLDGDGSVSVFDYGILSTNFDLSGD